MPYASGLKGYDQLKQVVVRVILRGLTDEQEVYKVVMLIDKNKWCLAMRLPVLYKYPENLDDLMMIQLFKDCEFQSPESFLGQANVYWKESISAEEQWRPSATIKLENMKNYSVKQEITGMLAVQVKYIP